MALSLDEINLKKKIKSKKGIELSDGGGDQSKGLSNDKEKIVRPWEKFEDQGNQTRTIVAQEAVRKAREIVERNNEMIHRFQESFEETLKKRPERAKSEDLEEDCEDYFVDTNKEEKRSRPLPRMFKKKSGIINMMKEIFFPL